ncbi:MAG: D-2-hydroxyacid dehydrogenase [Abditibacteriales bacterium]|nr:D-2-hydroxyacid dehydrogenase [Abditibacteriales bacterium]MDW8368412.1 D-2-hydroxyacid dehydrogenase [Abditibacteriales bacterium]
MKILVYFPMAEEYYQLIRDAADGHRVVVAKNHEEAQREITDADVVYGLCPRDVFLHAKQLKWFQSQSAGLDAVLFPELIESEVIVTNAAGLYASHAAEHAFALLLGLTRGIHRFAENRLRRTWKGQRLVEIAGWTLGIIGMGGFGVEMARRGQGWGLRVIAVDAYRTEKPECVEALWGMERLNDLLSASDVVMIACPLTAETRHLLNAKNLSLMKPSAYLINVARGGIIDEKALIQVLQQRRIAGAGLDVFEVEPLPADSPLWELDNVILTPHVAGSSQHRPRRTVEFFCDNLRRYFAGEPLRNVVDKRKGF